MKNVIPRVLVLLLLFVLPTTAQAQTMKLGEVLVFNVPDIKPDADTYAFETYVLTQVAPAWNRNTPGMTLNLVRADRGTHRGRYMLAWTADTAERLAQYASTSGGYPFNTETRNKVGDLRPGFQPFVNSGGQYLEYHLVGADQVGELPELDVLGIHYTKVRPDRLEAFERFVVEKLNPAVANLRPDLRLLYYKPVRGADAGNYMTIFALTTASRDKYWPNGSDSDDLRAAFNTQVMALKDELSTYLVEDSYATGNLVASVYESREWADFVLIPAR